MSYISVYLERSRHSGNQEVTRQNTRDTRIWLDDSSVAANSMKCHTSPLPSSEFHSLDEYVLSCGFFHLDHINPSNRVVLPAIEALYSNAQQHPSEWNQVCRRSGPIDGTWPTLKQDFVLYILIAFAPEPLLHSYLGPTQLKLKDGTNPLIYAAHFHKIAHARTMLSRGIKLNRRGWDVRSPGQFLPLEVAVYDRNHEMVNLFALTRPGHIGLFGRGDIHAVAKNGDTLLHLAAKLYSEEDALELTKHLVHAGCMPCVLNSLQETPLHVAARSGFISVIEYLLSLNITLPPDILLAASTGYSVDARVIHYLIQEGATRSREEDRLERVKILVDLGCDPRARNLAGKTPLHNAAMRGFSTVLRYFLSRGVPLPDDILLSSTATTMRLLLEKGLDLRSVAADGITELMHRALDDPLNDPVEVARILICHGAGWDPSLKNSAGETAIHAAARNGNIDALKFFLSQNVPLPFDILLPAVISAKGSRAYDAVPLTRFLILEGASVNVAASKGNTPLHLVITSNFTSDEDDNFVLVQSWKLVKILLNCGADSSARNMDGQTPLGLAKEKGQFFEENVLRLVRNPHAHAHRSHS
ncbi:ankyrin repeat-containing domain protein [Butyriboletus roseoflavus]|nr:ankyrin repeat-containing domain protein [Butyriboletus roseoflavus]